MSDPSIASIIERAFARERLRNIDRRFVHAPFLIERRLSDYIVAGDREAALATLAEINARERATLASDRLRSLKNGIIGSCTIYTRAAIEGGVDSELAFTLSDTFIRRIESARGEEELAHFEEGMVERFIELVLRYRTEKRDVLVSRAARIVRARIEKKVTLAETAAALGVSAPYLSTQFRKKMGLSFVDFVHKMKVEEATYFLRATDLSVMEVAQMLGFTYQAHFSRVFRRALGLSPTAYRKAHLVA
ncbi:MAG TPA: helix-turn-helix domain-containing protein [Rectinemataceae bacterium]|nr:helix-turn-helix domain-containing protein [Rectinemataceae bacterium]